MRCLLPLGVLALVLCFGGAAYAQEQPSATLRQADADYREGVAALNRNDLKTAQLKFEAVVRLAPAVAQGHSALGAVLVREGLWAVGTRELEKALAIKPNDNAAQLNLAMVYSETGAAAKAVPLFAKLKTEAGTRQPLGATVLAAYARSLAANGQTNAAIVEMKDAVAQESGSPEWHDELGTLYAQEPDWESAEQEFARAVELKDGFARAHMHLGFALGAEQKPGAMEQFNKAYRLAPGDAEVVMAMGKAMGDAGNDAQAVPILQHAVELTPRSITARYQLALVLQRVNRVPEAVELLRHVVVVEPKNADALTNLGMALAQAHNATEGIPFLKRAIGLNAQDATAHQDLAAAYIQVNRIDDAVGELKTAIKLLPDSAELHYDLGAAYKLQDDAADAIPELESAEKLNPNGYEPSYVLGLLYMQVARYTEAAKQLEISLKLHPQNGEGWATLGSVYSKLDRLPEAVTALREAITEMPDQADSHLILASVLVKQHDTAGAAQERKVAADLMRQHMNLQRAEVATNSGKSLLDNGKLDDAIAQFRDALTFDPAYVEAHQRLAEALQKEGRKAEAAEERAKAEALGSRAK
ncbi:MAG TPA: tetratricopeptide repeat protein [Terracidiphilus sp.]|jgi:tetratricopeptide (TPR) repeat protein